MMNLSVFLFISCFVLATNANSFSATYKLTPQTDYFSILVLTQEDADWAICLNYNSNSNSDGAFPGYLPKECDFNENEYNAFVQIKATYSGNLMNISIYRSLIDVSFLLEQFDETKQAFVFDFILNDKTNYIMMNTSSGNMISIPEFIRKSDQNITMVTNSPSISQITPSLPQIDKQQLKRRMMISLSENEIAQQIEEKPHKVELKKEHDDTLVEDLDEPATKHNSVPTKLTIIEQLLEESKSILPLTAKRSIEASTIKTTLSTQQPKQTSKLHSILSTTKSFELDTSPTVQTSHSKSATKRSNKVKVISIKARHPDVQHIEAAQDLTTTILSETTQNLTTTILPETAQNLTTTTLPETTPLLTTPLLTTKRRYKNEEERLMEFLMNPRPKSKVEVIGEEDEDEELPELIMFEIAAKETKAPFVPTFHPIPLPNNKNQSAPSNKTEPCDPYALGPPQFPGYAGPGMGNFHNIMQFGPQNPLAGGMNGMNMGGMNGMNMGGGMFG